jgi:hypothetical protein
MTPIGSLSLSTETATTVRMPATSTQKRPMGRSRDGFDDATLRYHSDLDCAHIEIGENSVYLCSDEFGGHIVDRANAFSVLCRERRGDRCSVDSERGKGLEIGLDPGTAARIRSCNGDRDGSHVREAHVTKPFNSLPGRKPGKEQRYRAGRLITVHHSMRAQNPEKHM